MIQIRAENRETNRERTLFEYLKERFYNAVPGVYKKEAESHLEKSVSERRIAYLMCCLLLSLHMVYFSLCLVSIRLKLIRVCGWLGMALPVALSRKGNSMELKNVIRLPLKWLYFAAFSVFRFSVL